MTARRAIVVALFAAAACRPGRHPDPLPTAIQPARMVEGDGALNVKISGDFVGRTFTDFETSGNSGADEGFSARLGDTSLRRVRLEADGTLSAVVPEGLAPGVYDLTVTDSWDHFGVLASAFRVVGLSELDEVVAGFKFAPVGPQKAGVPFGITVFAVDADGAVVPWFNRTLSLVDLTGTAAPATVGYLELGKWAGQVEVGTAHQADVLRVTDDRHRTGSSGAFSVAPRDAAGLRFVTDPQAVLAGECSHAVRVRLVDLAGFSVPAGSTLAIDLAADPAAGFDLFQDATCESPLTGSRLDSGQTDLTVFFRSGRAGKVQLSASTGQLAGDSQMESVVASTPSRIAFATAPQTVPAGACSAAVRVESRDVSDNAAPVSTDVPVSLTASPAILALFGDAGCTTPLAAPVLAAGTSSLTFFFKGSRAGEATLTASTTTLGSDVQLETIVASTPVALSFVTPEQTLVTGDCSQAATVESRDSFGNPSPLSTPGTLALAGAGLQFFASAGCASPAASVVVFPSGQARASFWFKGATTGDFTVSATLPGLGSASQLAHIRPPLPDRLAFTTAPQALVAGTCSGATKVQARDPSDTPRAVAADTLVSLAAPANSGLAFFADPGCAVQSPSTTIAAGSDSATFFFKGTRSGAQEITATAGSWIPAKQTEQIDASDAQQISFRTPARIAYAGECSPAVTVGLQDTWGNLAIPPFAVSGRIVPSPASGVRLFSDAKCSSEITGAFALDKASPSFDVFFMDTLAGELTLLAQTTYFGTDSQLETIQAKVPQSLRFVTPERTTGAALCSDIIAVQALDALGNPVPVAALTPLSLTTDAGSDFAFFADGSCSTRLMAPAFDPGTDTVSFYVRGTVAGSFQITAAAFGVQASQQESVQPGATAKLAWAPIATPVPVNTPFPVRIEARDAYDNPTPSFADAVDVGTLSPHSAIYCHQNCSAAGTSATFEAGVWRGAMRGYKADTAVRLYAFDNGLTGASATFDVAAGPASSAPVAVLTASPAAVVAGQSVTLDASYSYDYQTSQLDPLEASFDPPGDSSGSAPWSAWTMTQSVYPIYTTPGIFHPRLAVRDPGGEVDYAATVVVVVAAPADLCVVTGGDEADDGAASCSQPGPDGVLSFAEAIRLAAKHPTPMTITFARPMTVRGSKAIVIDKPVQIVGGRSVTLLPALIIDADTLLADLELESSSIVVKPGATLTMYDVQWRDSGGLTVQGAADLTHLRVRGCQADCIVDDGSSALALRFSSIADAPAAIGLSLKTCAPAASPLVIQSSVFANLACGVSALCDRPMALRHATFDQQPQAVQFAGGTGHLLENVVFSRLAEAVSCGSATFAQRRYSTLSGVGSAGCVAGDPGELFADPLFVFPLAKDFRLGSGSPAVDTAFDLGLDLNAEAPGLVFGAGPDRGGVESR